MRSWSADITRNQLAVGVAVFVSFVGFDFIGPFLPLFVRELGVTDLGEAARWSAVILGTSPVIAAVVGPLWGMMADRFGAKRIFQNSLLGFTVLIALMAFAQDPWHLLLTRGSLGVFGGYTALSLAMITTAVATERVGRAIALQQSAQMLALVVAPAVAGIVAELFGLRATFILAAALCLASLGIVQVLYSDPKEQIAARRRAARPSLRDVLRAPGLGWALPLVFLVQLLDRSFNLLLPLQVSVIARAGESVPVINGILFSAGALAGIVSATVLGRFAVGTRTTWLIIASLAGGALLSVVMGGAAEVLHLVAARIVHGLLSGGSLTVAYAYASRTIPDKDRGTGFAVMGSAATLGSGLSYPVAAVAVGHSVQPAFVVIAGLYLAAIALVLVSSLVARRLPRPAATAQPD